MVTQEVKEYVISAWHTYGKTLDINDRVNYVMKWTIEKFPEFRDNRKRAKLYNWVYSFFILGIHDEDIKGE